MRRRTQSQATSATAPVAVPRDVEAVEAVIDRLDQGITSDAQGDLLTVEILVRELGLGFGAVWLPADDDVFRLQGAWGPLGGGMAGNAGGQLSRLTAADGFGGEAVRARRSVVLDQASNPSTCQRWAAARAAGATVGCLVPVVESGRVTALYEFYNDRDLPFLSARRGKW